MFTGMTLCESLDPRRHWPPRIQRVNCSNVSEIITEINGKLTAKYSILPVRGLRRNFNNLFIPFPQCCAIFGPIEHSMFAQF